MKKITLTFAALAAFTMAPVSFAHIDGVLYEHVWSGDSQDDPLTAGDLWSNGVVPGEGLAAGDPNTQDDILHSRNAQLVIPADNSWSVDWINLGYVRADENDTGSARIIQNGSDVYANGYVRIGQNAGSLGIWEINGGSLTLRGKNTDGPLQVAANGTGILRINGGEINVGYGTNGWSPAIRVADYNQTNFVTVHEGQTGTVEQTGGTVNTGRLIIAQGGGHGEWHMSGGVINTSSWVTCGGYGDSYGHFTMTGGEINIGTHMQYTTYPDLKTNPPDVVVGGGDVLIPGNTSTRNGTYLLIGSINRGNAYTTGREPTGLFEQSGGKILMQGDTHVGNGISNTANQGGANGTLNLSGDAEFVNLGSMWAGRSSGTGTIKISENASLIVGTHLRIGTAEPSGSENTVNNVPNGGTSRDPNKVTKGTVNQTNGTVEVRGHLYIGDKPAADTKNSEGYYNISNGILSVTKHIVVGRTAGYGELNITGGIVTKGATDSFIIAAGGKGIVNQSGGVMNATQCEFWIGEDFVSAANATYNMNGGEANFGVLLLGRKNTGLGINSTFNLNGGIVSARSIGADADPSVISTFNFNGGTLKANEDTPEIFITDQVDEIKVSADSYIDTNGRNFTIAAPLTGTGNLIILGGGHVEFTGDNSGHAGAIIIDGEPPNPTGNFDSWATEEFSEEERENPEISGPEADPQNIGVPNLLRYALGLSRNESPVGALPTLTKNDTAGTFGALSDGNSYTFSFRCDTTKKDISYIVETSTDLKNWETVDTEPTIDEENGTASVIIPADGAVRKFFRLKIVQK